ncbi:hypothetical protein BS47DRAFT_1403410 [Hydnum rufescens UP504]|uniref:Uncharacterized protein n=1 Tax=Hydnum rufescens UP504 TaxID=1448309 RepID=A0A9P6AA01_9AGAM|nr:hypothetical protein BS47DRAFT_1403410 [Hydnum rufescens UP504]
MNPSVGGPRAELTELPRANRKPKITSCTASRISKSPRTNRKPKNIMADVLMTSRTVSRKSESPHTHPKTASRAMANDKSPSPECHLHPTHETMQKKNPPHQHGAAAIEKFPERGHGYDGRNGHDGHGMYTDTGPQTQAGG